MYVARRHRKTLRASLILTAFAGIVLMLGLPAQAQSFQSLHSNSYGQVEFNTPSGNIGCVYTPAGGTPVYETVDGGAELYCDRVQPEYVRAFIGGNGQATVFGDVGEPSCCGDAQQLKYGMVAQVGPFQCLSERRGLTC